MDVMGDNRAYVAGSGAAGPGLTLSLPSTGSATGGGGSWTVTPTLPTSEADLVTIDISTLPTDATANGTLDLPFAATGSPTGDLNWSLDSTLFTSPTTFGTPEEWTATISASDPTSPGTGVLTIGFASTDVFEAGLKIGIVVDDGVSFPGVAMYVTLNHTDASL